MPTREQRFDSREAAPVGAGHARDLLVDRGRGPVERDLDQLRRQLLEEGDDPLVDQRRVREDGDQDAAPRGAGVDLREVPPQQRLAAGDQQVQAAGVGHLVDQRAPEGRVQLARLERRVPLVPEVAVDAAQVAAVGHGDRAAQRDALGPRPVEHRRHGPADDVVGRRREAHVSPAARRCRLP